MQAIKMVLSASSANFYNKFLTLAFAALFALGVGAAYTLNTSTNAFADEAKKCFDFYGREIDCPVANKRFDIQKVAKMSTEGDSEYRDEVKGVLNDQTVDFKITVTNTGEVSVDDLKLIDFLPENLDTFQLDQKLSKNGTNLTFAFGDDFEPGEREVFLFSAQATVAGMDLGDEKCVVNKAQIYRDRDNDNVVDNEEPENADVATVCIKRGEVKGEQPTPTPTPAGELPDTAVGGLGLILGSLAALGSGAVLTKKVEF